MTYKDHAIWDTSEKYGVVTRCLHWGMATLLACQFFTAAIHMFAEDSALDDLLWPNHRANGFILLCLVLFRGAWALVNLRSRPPHLPSSIGRAARLGQVAMYVLMLIVPSLALLRAYGNGRGFHFFDFEVFAETGRQIAALKALGNDFHGPLGWCLLLLIAGHIAMSLVHHFILNDATLKRMTGGIR